MATNSNLYSTLQLPKTNIIEPISPKMYRGFSTSNLENENFQLYDVQLIKQDLLNHFNTRKGERLMYPKFGTIIWDMIFEPLTESVKNLIVQDVNEIINYDPRTHADRAVVTTYHSGIQIECLLTYRQYNINELLKLRFDQTNGLLAR